jgi:hypothetical protein
MSFATTWAIGQVAKQYYAGGRRMAAIDLRRVYEEQLVRGRELYTRQMADRAGALPLRGFDDIVGLLRGR